MNLLVSDGRSAIRPDQLPPPRRDGTARADGPVRALFLSSDALGWKTSSRQLAAATEGRADLLACHLILQTPPWMRVLNRRVPGRHHLMHPNRTWRWLLTRRLLGHTDAARFAGRFDVIHCNPQAFAFAPAKLKARFGYRLSVACDTTQVQFRRDLGGKPGGRVADDGPVFAAADSIAALSRFCARSLTDDYGVDPAKILLTLPNSPVPVEEPPPRPAGGPLRVVFVGNDWARKGGPRLLQWHQDRWASRGVELHVASAEAATHAPVPGVTWHGRLDHARVLALLNTADVLVHPTTADMSALVVAEAQALGVPAVTSRLAGIPDLLEDGMSGYLVDPHDDAGFVTATERVLFDDARRAAMSAAARAFARRVLDTPLVYGRLMDRLVALGRTATT